ncbi:hypothetical protein COCNU_01G014170 [Cocos nucifera]|uniref:Uncharacterized protein n=1 Tax=Cocos nucifera TaxID=13894 RepID=A0A8K0HWH7_COCNU|nr:hypothetical protein COCNU_01G014170 [Cocos nucifera]
MVRELKQLRMVPYSKLLEDLLKKLYFDGLMLGELCSPSQRKEKKRKRVILSPSSEAIMTKATVAKAGAIEAEAAAPKVAKVVDQLGEKRSKKRHVAPSLEVAMVDEILAGDGLFDVTEGGASTLPNIPSYFIDGFMLVVKA